MKNGKPHPYAALRDYINSLSVPEQTKFARRCGTSIGYLRKAISVRANLGMPLVIAIERNSGGKVRGEQLRRDIDWAYLRASGAAYTSARGG